MSPMMDLVIPVTLLTFLSDLSLVTGYQLASDQFRTGEHARQPVITSQARSLRAPLSDEVTLPCTVEHLGKLVVVWKHGEEVVTAGAMMVSPDPRYSLGGGYNLRVENLRGRDEGAYTCSVSTLSGPVTLTHNLEILVPPSVESDPPDGNFVVKKGKHIELRCRAAGNPPPDIHWTKEGGALLSNGKTVEHAANLVLTSVAREDEGTYICTASNGVGSPASASTRLTVLYPPEIELETNRVHSGINKEAHLTCRVQGNPEPIVSWYKDSNLLSESETVRFKTEEGRHTLILSSIHTGFDFGNYSCVAENSIGTFKKHIEVHGRPTIPIFRSKPNTHHDRSYELSWSVDSYSPIEEYRLLYRKIKPYHGPMDASFPLGEGDWTNVIIPGDVTAPGFTHLRSYLISGLLPESEYECLVQARNRFGWSDASRLFTFFTSTKAVASDLEWRSAFTSSSTPSSRSFTSLITLATLLGLLLGHN